MIDELDRFRYAQRLFDGKRYTAAAKELEGILAEASKQDPGHGLGEARLLLARAYYHSAQLTKAERAAREYIDGHPTDGYAVLLLARALERQGRHDEAAPLVARAEALGTSR